MGVEIERKFLLAGNEWRACVGRSVEIVQGYLAQTESCSIRARIAGNSGALNLKGLTLGVSRSEFEFEVPVEDARQIIEQYCRGAVIQKTRHYLELGGHQWEIDEFAGENTGLIVAELELRSENEVFDKPRWLGIEVTGEARYYNICLAKKPYRTWRHA